VQNLYKPYFLAGKFNYVIGNPPWFTFNSIKNEEYQNILVELAIKYDVKPVKAANMPQMEIAAIFLAYCANYFLKANGKLAFVLPRSFFSADHHDNTRSGKVKGFKITSVWDLDHVNPIFRVPSGVLIIEEKENKRNITSAGIKGIVFSGELNSFNSNLRESKDKLNEETKTWYYVKQGNSSALSTRKYKNQQKENPYRELFKNGATIYPRPFYFVELNQEQTHDWKDRVINIKTADHIKPDAKEPWKGIELKNRIESNFLFRVALAKSILPFSLYKPSLVVLPLTIDENDSSDKKLTLNDSEELRSLGFLNASKWFRDAENIWKIHKTERNKKITLEDYLNWQSKLTKQNINIPYIVIYNTTGKDANAVVIDRCKLDLEFIVDYKAFVFYSSNINEAYYLSAILNSSIPNELMKDFQSKGLFGARDVSKKILDIYFPRFEVANEVHQKLAELSESAHKKAAKYLEDNPPQKELTATRLGKLRLDIKKHLAEEMKEIDRLVKKVVL
jgi:hypothetical protein